MNVWAWATDPLPNEHSINTPRHSARHRRHIVGFISKNKIQIKKYFERIIEQEFIIELLKDKFGTGFLILGLWGVKKNISIGRNDRWAWNWSDFGIVSSKNNSCFFIDMFINLLDPAIFSTTVSCIMSRISWSTLMIGNCDKAVWRLFSRSLHFESEIIQRVVDISS